MREREDANIERRDREAEIQNIIEEKYREIKRFRNR